MKSIANHLGVSFCSMTCLDFLPALIGSSDNTSFSDRFSMYWRDSVMLAGIVITVITTVAAIFQGALFLAFVSGCIAGILTFGAHYVSRYAELKEMEDQLKKLQKETTRLESLNHVLGVALTNLQGENSTYHTQNGELRASISQFQEQLHTRALELQETSRQFEEFKAGNHHLRETSDMLKERRAELDQTTDRLGTLSADYHRIQGSLASDAARLHQIQEAIARDSKRLEGSATRFERLESVAQRLGQYVESLPGTQDQTVLLEVRSLLSQVKA
jgi:chromosome segregation ATPase